MGLGDALDDFNARKAKGAPPAGPAKRSGMAFWRKDAPPKPANEGLLATRTREGDEAPEPAIRAWGEFFLSTEPVAVPRGQHASWWREPDDPTFSDSATLRDMARAFRAGDRIASYLVADLVERWLPGAAPPGATRVALPEESVTMAARHPDAGVLVLTASREKGLRLHFSHATPREVREAAWRQWADYVVRTRAVAEATGAALDPEEAESPRAWFEHAARVVRQREAEGATFDAFGILLDADAP